jgi:hypothetical protein
LNEPWKKDKQSKDSSGENDEKWVNFTSQNSYNHGVNAHEHSHDKHQSATFKIFALHHAHS